MDRVPDESHDAGAGLVRWPYEFAAAWDRGYETLDMLHAYRYDYGDLREEKRYYPSS